MTQITLVHFADKGIALLGVAIVLSVFAFAFSTLTNPTSKVPGPWYTKWTGLHMRYYWLTAQRAQYVHALHKKYGPFVRISPNEVVISDIETVKGIYSTKESFLKTSFYTDLTGAPPSLFTSSNVPQHRKLRRSVVGQMSESSLKLHSPIIAARAQLAILKMQDELSSRGVIDVFKWCLFYATDVIGELSFGESFRMLERGEKNQYIQDFEMLAGLAAYRCAMPELFSIAKRVPWAFPMFKGVIKNAVRLLGYARQSLDRYKKNFESDPTAVKQTFFTKLYDDEANEKLTADDILGLAQDLIIGGSDTTANTLTYLLWAVCQRPHLQRALVAEAQSLPDDFTDADIKGLLLLNHTIDETLRLYSAAPGPLPRHVPPTGAEVGPYWLKGGTVVTTQIYSLHRDPDVFPHAEEFDPYRWENPTKAMKDAFMPYGRGSRVCAGIHLAYIELRFLFAHFLRKFPTASISTKEGMNADDMEQTVYFLMNPKNKRCLIEA